MGNIFTVVNKNSDAAQATAEANAQPDDFHDQKRRRSARDPASSSRLLDDVF